MVSCGEVFSILGRQPAMKKVFILAVLFLLSNSPLALNALTNEQMEGTKEIAQGWVDRHNEKLAPAVKDLVKGLRAGKHALLLSSLHKRVVPMKRLRFGVASRNGIPLEVKSRDGSMAPLWSLYQAKTDGLSFLIADYYSEYDALDSSSDIYIKIGLVYKPLFHGQGYKGCARLLTLGKNSPLFFEIGTFGGGSNCNRVIYTLNQAAVKGMVDDLYSHPESMTSDAYVKEALELNVWREGFTLYKEVNHDGVFEIINTTQSVYPEDLKTKLKEKYEMVDNDFAGSFRETVSVYMWDNSKSQFQDLGDYYY